MTLEIAATLRSVGTYRVLTRSEPVQRLVDIQWAGCQAGRLLGGRSCVEVSGPVDDIVSVTITYHDPDGAGLGRAREGLAGLLRFVRDEQSKLSSVVDCAPFLE